MTAMPRIPPTVILIALAPHQLRHVEWIACGTRLPVLCGTRFPDLAVYLEVFTYSLLRPAWSWASA